MMNNQTSDHRGADRKNTLKNVVLAFFSGFGVPLIKHPDERIAATTQRWAAFSGAFLSIALAIDIMVRVFALRQDPGQYWDLGLIWLINMFVVTLGQVKGGVPACGTIGRLSWKTSGLLLIEIMILIPVLMLLIGHIHTVTEFLIQAALAGGSGFLMLMLMRALYAG